MSLDYSYRHLYYFWVVAKAGGLSKGAAQLGMAVQTVSAQVRDLERALGHALLKPAGRGVALTEAGQVALRQADLIFQLGESLPQAVREAATAPTLRLAVGISDGLPKLMVHRIMQPVLAEPNLRLLCHEGEFDDLLADLALHRLDVVLADRPAPANPSLRLHSQPLSGSPMAWYAPPAWADAAAAGYPQSLATVPVLLPTPHSVVRALLDRWFERHGVRPRVAGEFEDSALLKTFGAGGMGVFPAPQLVEGDLAARYGVVRIGTAQGVDETVFAVSAQKRVSHPLVRRLMPGAG